MDEILVKYILDEASDVERQIVEQWLKADEQHQKHLEQLRLIWSESKKLELSVNPDVDAAWQKFRTRTERDAANTKQVPLKSNRWLISRLVASVAIVLMATIGYYAFFANNIETVIAGNTVLTDTLPDNSIVTLNKNTKLTYHKNFNKDNRAITLEGEAFFNVASNKAVPFVITSDKVSITVVGTEFNVKDASLQTVVIVESGKVQVHYKDRSVMLDPGQKAVVDKSSGSISVQQYVDAIHNYYRTKSFICNNTPLSELINALSQNFNVPIDIAKEQVATLPITASFKEDNLDEILNIIAHTFDVEIVKNDTGIVIK